MKYAPRSRSALLHLPLAVRRDRVHTAPEFVLAVIALMTRTTIGMRAAVRERERDMNTTTLLRVFNEKTPNERRAETMIVRVAQDWRPDACEERATLKAGWEQ